MRTRCSSIALSLLLLPIVASVTTAQWQEQGAGVLPEGYFIFSIAAVNENVVWMVADSVRLPNFTPAGTRFLRTTDGGGTWTAGVVTGLPGTMMQMDIAAVDADTAWISANGEGSGGGGIYKTIDGGATWRKLNVGFAQQVWIHFFNARNGVAINLIDIGTTTDGGETWKVMSRQNIPSLLPNEVNLIASGNNSRAAIGDTIWVGTSRGRVMRSVDRGENWTATPSGLGENAAILTIAFRDARNGLAASAVNAAGAHAVNRLARTTDGGDTWMEVSPMIASPTFSSLSFLPGTSGAYMIVSADAALSGGEQGSAYSTDDGESWINLDGGDYNSVAFVSPTTGWAGGPVTAEHSGIYRWSGGTLRVDRRKDDAASPGFDILSDLSSVVRLSLPARGHTVVTVVDMKGDRVATIVDGELEEGEHVLSLPLVDTLPCGIYFVSLHFGGKSVSRKLLRLR
jgi:photosystem II stability/assembly factor-like uncharacterized protein